MIERLGDVRLRQLDVHALEKFFAKLRKDDVGDRTRQLCYNVLRSALKRAVRSRVLDHNPIEAIDRPRVERREIEPWSREEALLVLEAAKADRFYALYLIELRLGLQYPGEVLGLRWNRDVDLDAKKLRVGGQLGARGCGRVATKTDARRRELDLPEPIVAALRAHQKRLMKDGLRASPWVFPNTEGNAQDTRGFVRRSFDPIVNAAGRSRCRTCTKTAELHENRATKKQTCGKFVPSVRRLRPYDMRHTFATLALQANVHIKVVSRMLGHASLKRYAPTRTFALAARRRKREDRAPIRR